MEYTLHVDPQDIGRVIGKQGRVARANPFTITPSDRTRGQNVCVLVLRT